MTSTWNENFSLFTQRFPELAKMLAPQIPKSLNGSQDQAPSQDLNGAAANKNQSQDQNSAAAFLNKVFPFYNFSVSKSGALTASQNGLPLHSAYNPKAEAERAAALIKDTDKDILVFAGIGLGYLAAAAARIPGADQKTFLILEPDPLHFFAALASIDLCDLFKIPKIFFAVGAGVEQAASLVQCAGGFDKAQIFCQKSQAAHAQEWFDSFFTRARQSKDAAQVNVNTLERFGRLWLKNGARNLPQMQKLCGVKKFFGAADFSQKSVQDQKAATLSKEPIPAVLIAAGPSLESVLPHLKEIHQRAITIAVDTALRACLRAEVQPDFIVLTDPQYWAYSHIAGLSAPQSILIAESAAYPSVFRFDCKEIVLMSSLFPLGKFIEGRLGAKGQLASGGSVATSAWDFARAIGCKEIYAAGLDLGYPNKQTHIKGSAFEQAAHNASCRLNPAELATARILFSAKNQEALDFEGNKIITDERMKLFAWWFEKHIADDRQTKTFTFSKKGLAIKGAVFFSLQDFLKKPEISEQKKAFFALASRSPASYEKEKFDAVMAELKDGLVKIDSQAKKGIALCNDILCGDRRAQQRIGDLDQIDQQILQSDAKNVAALVFPSQRQLEKLFL
ncbi:MAG: motility associated factor glycosyltransferase family protein, partial [Treponema sp.]|nr:motility associated factor glycosyltransferase family protein [Treponema sp.]